MVLLQARASRSETAAAADAGDDSQPSASGQYEKSASTSGTAAASAGALSGNKAKRKKTAKHADPAEAAAEAIEAVSEPEPPTPEEVEVAKALLKKMHRLRHQAPNAEELIAELGDPDPNDPKCIAEIVDHMRLSHAIDPVGGIPDGEPPPPPLPPRGAGACALFCTTYCICEISGSNVKVMSQCQSCPCNLTFSMNVWNWPFGNDYANCICKTLHASMIST